MNSAALAGGAAPVIERRIRQRIFPKSVGGGSSSGGSGTLSRVGLISAVQGSGNEATYTVTDFAGNVLVTAGTPYIRPFGPEVDLIEARVGDYAELHLTTAGTWFIWRAPEQQVTTSCTTAANLGSINSTAADGVLSADRLVGRAELRVDYTFTGITSGNQNQYGVALLTLPQGVIAFQGYLQSYVITSAAITNQVKVAIGTADASGGASTSFAPDEQNIGASRTTSAVTSSGITEQNFGPATSADVDNTLVARNGASAPIVAYLNLCPSANWNANGDIIVTGTVRLVWINLGTFDL